MIGNNFAQAMEELARQRGSAMMANARAAQAEARCRELEADLQACRAKLADLEAWRERLTVGVPRARRKPARA